MLKFFKISFLIFGLIFFNGSNSVFGKGIDDYEPGTSYDDLQSVHKDVYRDFVFNAVKEGKGLEERYFKPGYYDSDSIDFSMKEALAKIKGLAHVKNNYNSSLLHMTAWFKGCMKNNIGAVCTEIAKHLIEVYNVDVNAQNKNGETPLLLAVQSGGFSLVSLLLDKGANPFLKNKNGETPLHYSVSNKGCFSGKISSVTPSICKRIAEVLLSKVKDKNTYKRMKNKDGKTAWGLLNKEQQKGNDWDFLLPDGTSEENYIKTFFNIVKNQPDRVTGLKNFIKRYPDIVKVKDSDGNIGLYYAVMNDSFGMVKVLVDAGSDVNFATDEYDGETTLLEYAIGYVVSNDISILLVKNGANVDVANNGMAVLHYACLNKKYELVKLLIEKGANVSVTNNDGETPLHYTVKDRALDVSKYLVEKGANVNIKNNDGNTPWGLLSKKEQSSGDWDFLNPSEESESVDKTDKTENTEKDNKSDDKKTKTKRCCTCKGGRNKPINVECAEGDNINDKCREAIKNKGHNNCEGYCRAGGAEGYYKGNSLISFDIDKEKDEDEVEDDEEEIYENNNQMFYYFGFCNDKLIIHWTLEKIKNEKTIKQVFKKQLNEYFKRYCKKYHAATGIVSLDKDRQVKNKLNKLLGKFFNKVIKEVYGKNTEIKDFSFNESKTETVIFEGINFNRQEVKVTLSRESDDDRDTEATIDDDEDSEPEEETEDETEEEPTTATINDEEEEIEDKTEEEPTTATIKDEDESATIDDDDTVVTIDPELDEEETEEDKSATIDDNEDSEFDLVRGDSGGGSSASLPEGYDDALDTSNQNNVNNNQESNNRQVASDIDPSNVTHFDDEYTSATGYKYKPGDDITTKTYEEDDGFGNSSLDNSNKKNNETKNKDNTTVSTEKSKTNENEKKEETTTATINDEEVEKTEEKTDKENSGNNNVVYIPQKKSSSSDDLLCYGLAKKILGYSISEDVYDDNKDLINEKILSRIDRLEEKKDEKGNTSNTAETVRNVGGVVAAAGGLGSVSFGIAGFVNAGKSITNYFDEGDSKTCSNTTFGNDPAKLCVKKCIFPNDSGEPVKVNENGMFVIPKYPIAPPEEDYSDLIEQLKY